MNFNLHDMVTIKNRQYSDMLPPGPYEIIGTYDMAHPNGGSILWYTLLLGPQMIWFFGEDQLEPFSIPLQQFNKQLGDLLK